MPRNVSVSSGTLRYAQTISIGPHVLHSDEPADVSGNDMGPTRMSCSWPRLEHVRI
jgi:hypothetical protein